MLKAGLPTLLIWHPLSLAVERDMDLLFMTPKVLLDLGCGCLFIEDQEAVRSHVGQVVVAPLVEWAVLTSSLVLQGRQCWKG